MTYNCLEGTNSLYIERHSSGYIVSPCCLYKDNHNSGIVPNIEDLIDNPYINKIKEGFKGDWKRPACVDCILKESSGKKKKKQK